MKLSNLSYENIHKTATIEAKNLRISESKLIELLGVIDSKKIYLKYDCHDIYEYGEKHLKFSRRKIYDFLNIYKASFEIPALRKEIKKNDLSYTKIRTVLPALQKINQKTKDKAKGTETLLNMAKTKTVRELERTVKEIAPSPKAKKTSPPPKWISGDKIERVARLDVKDEVILDKAINLISAEMKRFVSFEEFLKIVAERVIQDKLKKGSKKAIIVAQESNNKKIKVTTSSLGELEISKAETSQIENKKKFTHVGRSRCKSYIPAKVREKIVKRDGSKCKICKKVRNIQIHHIKPVSEGGKNTEDNLVVLCGSCHADLHRGFIELYTNGDEICSRYNDKTIPSFTDYLFEEKRKLYLSTKNYKTKGRIKKNQLEFF